MDYLRLAAESGASVALESLLLAGPDAWPERLRKRYRSLGGWSGVRGLKAALRQLLRVPPTSRVFLASRSHVLMRMAAYLLVQRSRRVLTVDVGWPAYHAILRDVAGRHHKEVVEVPIKELILGGASSAEVVSRVVSDYRFHECRSLFLPAISNEGIRLPVAEILHTLRSQEEIRFAVVDGAQEVTHRPLQIPLHGSDFYITGTHKWLRGYHPLGIGVYARPETAPLIDRYRLHLYETGVMDDPLLSFSEQLEANSLDGISETVNLTPLFSAKGAIDDANRISLGERTFPIQRESYAIVADLAQQAGWSPRQMSQDFQTGILMLRRKSSIGKSLVSRTDFARHQLALTTYDSGEIRVSIPRRPLRPGELNALRTALAACA